MNLDSADDFGKMIVIEVGEKIFCQVQPSGSVQRGSCKRGVAVFRRRKPPENQKPPESNRGVDFELKNASNTSVYAAFRGFEWVLTGGFQLTPLC